jgi:hypothetical protein
MDKMGKSTQKTQGIIGKIGGIAKGAIGGLFKIGLAAGAAAIGGVALLGGALFKLASDAAPIASIKKSFEDMTASMEGGSKAVLAALKEQSAGMITNTDLMKSFNLATLLIGESFTKQLPDAMKFVGKVALATGEDMGFLMDSLVRGVGRLSPMILDNLGIVVNLAEAYEDWSKENGIAVSEMSKVEQQAAVMAQTMSKLEEKTANMPEVAGSAQQAFGSFGVMMKNFKDELGLAVLPAVTDLMKTLSELAAKVLPRVVDFFKKKVVPILEKFGEIIKKLVAGEFKFENILPPFVQKIWEDFIGVIDKFRKWWERNGPFILMQAKRIFGTITDTISKLAESIIPWVIEQFDKISAWFDEHEDDITGAIKTIADFFENTLGPAVTSLWTNVLQPFFGDFITGILDVAGVLIEAFGGGREKFFDVGLGVESLGPRQRGKFFESMQGLDDILKEFLTVKFQQHWINFREWVASFTSLGSWQAIADSWQGIWDNMGLIVETWIANMKEQLTWKNLLSNLLEARIPGFVTPELPPPPQVFPEDPSHFEGQIPSPFFPGNTTNNSTSENNFNLTVNTSAPVEPIIADFRMMRAMKGRV